MASRCWRSLLLLLFCLGIIFLGCAHTQANNSNAHEDNVDPARPLGNDSGLHNNSDNGNPAPLDESGLRGNDSGLYNNHSAAVNSPIARPLPVAQESPGLRAGSRRFSIGDGFFFHRQRAAAGRVFLRCVMSRSNPPCRVRASMHEDFTHFTTFGDHNHGADLLHHQVQQLRNSIIEACRVRPNARVDVIYHDVCRNVNRELSSRVSLLSVRPSMIRAQAEHRPNIPYTFEDLNLAIVNSAQFRLTHDGAEEYYRGMTGEPGHRSLVFLSDRVIEGFAQINFLFGDATFYSRPNNPESAQLYTFVSMRDNHVVPLCHALMESRSAQAYQALFQFFRQLAPNVDPEYVVTDFEVAQLQALRAVFPLTRHSGCLWHYARAVCRNVRSLGLHAVVRDNDNARRILRLSMSIPLVPPNRIQEALNAIIVEARRLFLFNEFEGFFNYIRTTWIDVIGPEVLSVFGVRHRTNNAAESHHRNLNSRLVRRPNIWRFLELMSETEDTAWRDLGRLEQGFAPSRVRRVTSLLNDARVRSCSRQLLNNEMDLLHFMSTVSWHLDPTMREMLVEREVQNRPPSPERSALPVPQQDADNNMCPSLQELDNVALPPGRPGSQLQELDEADRFLDLMESNAENVPPARGRNRGRGRGRGRVASNRGRGTGRGRGRNQQPVVSGSSGSTASSVIPPLSAGTSTTAPVPANTASSTQPSLISQNVQHLVNRTNSFLRSELPGSVQMRDEFSDSEDVPEDEHPDVRPWRECIICYTRVGHYCILGCGAFPVCGQCINEWFILRRMHTCPHCGNRTPGWVRLDL